MDLPNPLLQKILRALKLSTGTVIVIMIAAIIAAFSIVFFKIWTSDNAAAQREIASVARVFEAHKSFLLNEMERYAASNAAYINVDTAPSPDWIHRRFAVDMASDFTYDAVYVIDPDHTIVFSDIDAADYGASFNPLSIPALRSEIDRIRDRFLEAVSAMSPQTVNFAGLFSELSGTVTADLGDHAVLASVFAIVPDPGNIEVAKRPPHLLVTLHTLNEAHLNRILKNLSLSNLIFVRDVPADMNSIEILSAPEAPRGYLAWHPMSNGSSILLSSAPVLLTAIGIILVITFLTIHQNARVKQHLAQREQQARYAADHDGMTGFAQRQHFSDLVKADLRKNDIGHCALIYLDVDRLKQINDTHSHAAGDKLIKTVADRTKDVFRKNDIFGRVGGDEFLIFARGRSNPDVIVNTVRELLRTLRHPVEFEDLSLQISCSVGIAFYPEHGRDLTELTRAGDIALQRSKTGGRNTYRIFDPAMDNSLKERRELQEKLALALQNGEFELHYQPVIDIQTGRPVYAEALLRWRHPEKGLVPPDRFIPIAEDENLMPKIGDWVLRQAVADACRWKDMGVSVNICTSQLMQEGFARNLSNLLDAHGFPAGSLTLEITESQILDEVEKTQKVLTQLQEIGVNCAMDDFGTGYSSLSYLHRYDFNTLKVDKRFVQEIDNSENSRKLLATMIDLGKILGMSVVVEGVETGQQLDFLTGIGCRYVQGFYFSRPRPITEFQFSEKVTWFQSAAGSSITLT
ncbi:putative bifunctional diguanylate cyclase/phosphodiesterase [Roseibium aggregatum]|uniref:Bifunctional diguanylate cyclase/phosphodiesterase n=1 Tax=Roseibium aggregatum TaxID=187304 RepID=A0A939J617_9HYPH|nr:bifunctional diguanylate cyclase/phosphodiesterase [Roseibium aggregatum]MBN9672329.1 bifunctional diguanylate cyclase/phosphodiesterase [Roseibium aggregatum]